MISIKLLEHIKLTTYVGFMVGIFFGVVDFIARFIVGNIGWFSFYQILVISIITFAFTYFILSIAVELIMFILRLKRKKEKLTLFYTASTFSFLLFLYLQIFIVRIFLFPSEQSLNSQIIKVVIIITVIVGILYVLLLTKFKKLTSSISLFFKKVKVKKVIKDFIFILIVFIIASFFIDLYLMNTSINEVQSKKDIGESPNILLITLDTVNAKHLSLYGYPKNTSPYLDELGKNSVVFENAISGSPWTLPAHASIFTGKYISNHNANMLHQKLDDGEITLAEILNDKGYTTAGFIGGPFCKSMFGVGQGFDSYKDRLDFLENTFNYDKFDLRPVIHYFLKKYDPLSFKTDNERISYEINKDVFKWLDKNKDTTFFMFINYFDAHDPYTLGREYIKQFTNLTRDYDENLGSKQLVKERYGFISEDTLEYVTAAYDAEIFYQDKNLKKLIDKFDELGIKDNTIIIITSDHGEEFYEHGGFGHRTTLYEEAIKVPLIIHYPKKFKTKRIEQRVGTMNIFSTVLDILQIEGPKGIDSISLLPLLMGETGYNRNYVFSELTGSQKNNRSRQQAISYKNWKTIIVNPKNEALPSSIFDLNKDPSEQNNLYEDDEEGIQKGTILNKLVKLINRQTKD